MLRIRLSALAVSLSAIAAACGSPPAPVTAPASSAASGATRAVAPPAPAPTVAGKPVFVMQAGLSDSVNDVQWSPDGSFLAVSMSGPSVRILDAKTGLERASYSEGLSSETWGAWIGETALALWPAQKAWNGVTGEVAAHPIEVGPDLSFAAAGSVDGTRVPQLFSDTKTGSKKIVVFDLQGRKPVAETAVPGDGRWVYPVLGAKGRWVAWSGFDAGKTKVYAWEVGKGAPRVVRVQDGEANGRPWLAWGPDGLLSVSTLQGSAVVVDAATGAVRKELPGAVRVDWSVDGKLAAVSGRDPHVADATTWQKVRPLNEWFAGGAVRWSPDGTKLALSTRGKHDTTGEDVAVVRVLDVSGNEWLWEQTGSRRPGAHSSASRDGMTVSSGALVWDLAAGRLRSRIRPGYVSKSFMSPDGSLVMGLPDGVEVYDSNTGEKRKSFAAPQGQYFDEAVWSPDGKLIVARYTEASKPGKPLPKDRDAQYAVLDVASGRTVRTFGKHRYDVASATTVTPSGEVILAHSDKGRVLDIWRLSDGRHLRTVRLQTGDCVQGNQLVSPQGDAVVVECRIANTFKAKSMVVVDVATGKVTAKLTPRPDDELWDMDWSHDGKSIAARTVRPTKEIVVWDRNGQQRSRFPLPHAISWMKWAAGDKAILASTSDEIHLFRVTDGASVSLHGSKEDGSIAYTDDGQFDGDDKAFGRIWFRVGADRLRSPMVSADQLFERFHHPNLVADLIAGRSLAPRPDAQQGIGLPPRVEFSDSFSAKVSDPKLTVRVRATDAGGGISELRVFVNGVRVDAGRGLELDGPSASWLDRSIDVLLGPGDNEIVAEAYSVIGKVRSTRAKAKVALDAAATGRPNLHLLAVSVDDYQDPSLKLSFANADGDAVVRAFQAQEGKLYGKVQVVRLKDSAVTREKLAEAAAGLTKGVEQQDVFVFYAAGHGTVVQCPGAKDMHYMLVPYDASLRSDTSLCSRGVTDEVLSSQLRPIPARKKLVILDTCHAGAAATENMLVAMRGAADVDAIKRLSRAEGMAIIAAAQAKEYAGEVPALGHGVFTYALLQGLAGKAPRVGSSVTVFNLLSYVSDEVATLSDTHLRRRQFPITSMQGQDFPVVVP